MAATRAVTTLAIAIAFAAAMAAMAKQSPRNEDFFFANYFPNWAQYRLPPFEFTPKTMQPVVDKFKYNIYAFAWFAGGCNGCGGGPTVYQNIGQCKFPNGTCSYFSGGTREAPECPAGAEICTDKNFTLVSPEPNDPQFYEQVVEMKRDAPGQKVILSVGGWNFPSSAWSEMVASPEGRKSFIDSCMDFMEKYGFDGIDLDWEFWCSPPREDHIKIDNESFINLYDVGGECPDDGKNLLTLVQEMRQAFGPDKLITVATQADLEKMVDIDIKAVSDEIDYWNLMAYDYSVSDLPEKCGDDPCFANFTAPNQPLYAVKEGQIPEHTPPFPSSYWSVNYTIKGYIAAGAPPEKLVLGLTFYGHHWYTPNVTDWKRFGVEAAISGTCHGPFTQTFGGWSGRRARLCGTLIYSEIMSLIDPTDPEQNFFDNVTMSDIGYIKDGSQAGEDLSGATPGWVSWNSIQSLEAITKFAMDEGIAGVFAFDASMDEFDKNFPVVNAIYDLISNGGHSNTCSDGPDCNVCSACCKSYLKTQSDCNQCVSEEC